MLWLEDMARYQRSGDEPVWTACHAIDLCISDAGFLLLPLKSGLSGTCKKWVWKEPPLWKGCPDYTGVVVVLEMVVVEVEGEVVVEVEVLVEVVEVEVQVEVQVEEVEVVEVLVVEVEEVVEVVVVEGANSSVN